MNCPGILVSEISCDRSEFGIEVVGPSSGFLFGLQIIVGLT